MSQTLHHTFAEIWPRPQGHDTGPFPTNHLTQQYRPYPNDTPVALLNDLDADKTRHVVVSIMALFGVHRDLIVEPLRGELLKVLEPLVPEGAQSLTFDDDEGQEWWAELLDAIADPLNHTA